MLYLLTREAQSNNWIKCDSKPLLNIISSTALAWKPNGSSIALGSASGLLIVYNTIYRRYLYNNTFEITHISTTDVIIHDKETPNSTPISIQSTLGEIKSIDIYPEPGSTELRYVVSKLQDALIFCDIKALPVKTSQIPWNHCSEVSFSFHDANSCLISSHKELSVIKVSLYCYSSFFSSKCWSHIKRHHSIILRIEVWER
jgi:intraflagellar transport protein 172